MSVFQSATNRCTFNKNILMCLLRRLILLQLDDGDAGAAELNVFVFGAFYAGRGGEVVADELT